MKRCLLLALLLLPVVVFSQNASEKWLHAYADVGYEERYLSDVFRVNGDTLINRHYEWGFRNVSLGFFRKKENGVYRELSLTSLRFEVEDDVNEVFTVLGPFPSDGERTTTAGLGVQFETGVLSNQWLGGFFRPGIGFGAAPQVGYFRYVPKVSTRFPYSEWSFGLGLNIVPRFHFRLSDRVSIAAVFPVRLVSTRLSFEKVEDPALLPEQRNTTNFSFDTDLEGSFARLGAAVRL
jgi:hypothetical protein